MQRRRSAPWRPGSRLPAALAAVAIVLTAACASSRTGLPADPAAARRQLLGFEPDLAIGAPPFDDLDVDWKHRLDQPFVFLERLGPPQAFGDLLDTVVSTVIDQGIEPTGAPFALFYASPLDPPAGGLRMRACAPVPAGTLAQPPLRYEVLPSTTVVYAFVSGPYPQAPLAYDRLFEFMEGLNWSPTGPAREVYYVSPAAVDDLSLLVAEIQIPAGPSSP